MDAVSVIDLEPPRELGRGCCASVTVRLDADAVRELTTVAKALADPVRLEILDVLRRQAGEVCVCDLESLFDVSQPTLSYHLRRLREAGIVGVVRRAQWAYYFVIPEKLEAFRSWLS